MTFDPVPSPHGIVDVDWIRAGTRVGTGIDSAIPLRFEAYATLVIDDDPHAQAERLCEVLRGAGGDAGTGGAGAEPLVRGHLHHSSGQVLPAGAHEVDLYAGWRYSLAPCGWGGVLGHEDPWRGNLPDLLFPVDRTWLVSRLWDDDWVCLGGPRHLVDAVRRAFPALAREVLPGADATPPGRTAI